MNSGLFEEFKIKNLTLKNRIAIPPMVCFNWADESGYVSQKHIDHYSAVAKGGSGLVIQEATCVTLGGRLHMSQLGLWEDGQIEGHKKIVDAVHEEGSHIFVQLHHAGLVGVEEDLVSPSDYECEFNGTHKAARGLTLDEAEQLRDDFINGAKRAYEAGYDGVELHGCHNYLMCQFLNTKVNKRTDRYGISEAFVIEVMEGIRAVTPKDFIVGIRLGAFEPTLEDAISHGKVLESHGIDFLDISFGFRLEQDVKVPGDWELVDIQYAAKEIKKQVSIPVFTVFGIDSRMKAEEVLEKTNADIVHVGRGELVNYNWVNDAKEEKNVGRCLNCNTCMWRVDSSKCAGKLLLKRQRAEEAGNYNG